MVLGYKWKPHMLRSVVLLRTMKTTTVFLLLASPSLFFVLSIQLSVISANIAVDDYVRDVDGEPLRTGVRYYVLPVVRGRGGGLALDKKLDGSQCPLEVVQEQDDGSVGTPVIFTSVDPKAKLIPISTDLNIRFSAMSVCGQSMVWRLAEFDEPRQKRFIEMNGVEGNPGPATNANWFKIEEDGDGTGYKLVFCPSVCSSCRFACKNVGIYIGDDGVRRLALVDLDAEPFKIMFKKGSSTNQNGYSEY